VVVLPVFWSTGQLHTWWSPPLDAVVFAVVLAVGLPRAVAPLGPRNLAAAVAGLLAGAAAAVGCGMLLGGTSWEKAAGAVFFAIGAALPVCASARSSPPPTTSRPRPPPAPPTAPRSTGSPPATASSPPWPPPCGQRAASVSDPPASSTEPLPAPDYSPAR
jgi:hypothetical protein